MNGVSKVFFEIKHIHIDCKKCGRIAFLHGERGKFLRFIEFFFNERQLIQLRTNTRPLGKELFGTFAVAPKIV
jgi:hypothetical protein